MMIKLEEMEELVHSDFEFDEDRAPSIKTERSSPISMQAALGTNDSGEEIVDDIVLVRSQTSVPPVSQEPQVSATRSAILSPHSFHPRASRSTRQKRGRKPASSMSSGRLLGRGRPPTSTILVPPREDVTESQSILTDTPQIVASQLTLGSPHQDHSSSVVPIGSPESITCTCSCAVQLAQLQASFDEYKRNNYELIEQLVEGQAANNALSMQILERVTTGTIPVAAVTSAVLPLEFPDLPMQSFDALNAMEALLANNEERFTQLTKYLANIGGRTCKETTTLILARLFDEPITPLLNWSGRNAMDAKVVKRGIHKLETIRAVFVAVRLNPLVATSTDVEITAIIKTWVHGAGWRGGAGVANRQRLRTYREQLQVLK